MAANGKKRQSESAGAREDADEMATITLAPSVNAAAVVEAYGAPFGDQEINALVESLIKSTNKIHEGDMRQCEAMLLGQAHALQTIFVNLSLRATQQEHLNNYETFLRLALKAQSQCRATLETLAEIKNPPVAIVRQANIAHGPQQVNNGMVPPPPHAGTHVCAGELKNRPNQLLETHDGKRMDTRKTSATGQPHQNVAAVGALNRAEDACG